MHVQVCLQKPDTYNLDSGMIQTVSGRRTPARRQCFFFSRNIGQVTPKIIYFHYLIKYFPDQSIPKNILFNFEKRSTGPETFFPKRNNAGCRWIDIQMTTYDFLAFQGLVLILRARHTHAQICLCSYNAAESFVQQKITQDACTLKAG